MVKGFGVPGVGWVCVALEGSRRLPPEGLYEVLPRLFISGRVQGFRGGCLRFRASGFLGQQRWDGLIVAVRGFGRWQPEGLSEVLPRLFISGRV